jgi:arginine-tRNA-protein transferase
MDSNNKLSEINILEFHSNDSAGSCGYCKEDGKKKHTAYKWGFSSESITADLYEKLMFLGWRRCGTYFYKNDLSKSCCQLYSMRLDVDEFKISKSQKKVLKNFRKYLAGMELKNTADYVMEEENKFEDNYEMEIRESLKNALAEYKTEGIYLSNIEFKIFFNKNNKFGDYSTNLFIVIFQLFKNTDNTAEANSFYNKIFSDFKALMNDRWEISLSQNTGHLNFKIKSEEYKQFRQERIKFENKPQKNKKIKKEEVKLKDNETEYKLEYFEELITKPLIAVESLKHKYTIELEPNSHYSEEKFEVYKKYQKIIHEDKESELNKNRFLNSWGSSSLVSKKEFKSDSKFYPKGYGTYDMIHRIDGKIVAVGILDILPTSVSSVYLYYDPDYGFLNFGVLTAIKEIEFLKHLRKNIDNNFKFYVMGFYCYTCQKMRYKGLYHPSEILCPVTHHFVQLDSNIEKVKLNQYMQLSSELANDELNIPELQYITNNLTLKYHNKSYNLMHFIKSFIAKQHHSQIIKNVEDFVKTVGKININNFKFIID